MALFKLFRGDRALLDSSVPLKDGYAYFCMDTGEFFIDADFGGTTGIKRVQINANLAKGLTDGSSTIDIDDVVLTTDIIDIDHGGTGATTKAAARTALEVYSKTETDGVAKKSAAKRYSLTIPVNGWSGSGPYTYTYANTALTCGLAGDVPPLIAPEDGTDTTEYSKIDKAMATAGTGIVFTAEKKPEAALTLIIVDNAQK
ncbi:MAG: hypothetical protein NC218_09310 [Acetobacter sp.]|nr:hypothetical protein [Acetobacter sp.]